MADDLNFKLINQWHDSQLELGGTARQTTKIRYLLGKHGPYEATFDRNVDPFVVQQAIETKRAELRALLAI